MYDKNMNKACELCGLPFCLSEHHLTPQSVKEYAPETRNKSKVITLCSDCHGFLHYAIGNFNLCHEYYTLELLLSDEVFIKPHLKNRRKKILEYIKEFKMDVK